MALHESVRSGDLQVAEKAASEVEGTALAASPEQRSARASAAVDPGLGAVHQHCRFHGRDAPGPAIAADPGHQSFSVRHDRVELHDQCRPGRPAGVIGPGPVRSQARVLVAVLRLSGWHLALRPLVQLLQPAPGADRHRRVRRHSGRNGPGHRRRRLPRRTQGPRHGRADVGLRAGFGRRGACLSRSRHSLRLAIPLPAAGPSRHAGSLRGRAGFCRPCATILPTRFMLIPGGEFETPSARRIIFGPSR